MVFGQLKQLNQMRQQALKMQKLLAQEKVEVEENGIKIVMSGDQKVISLEIDGQEQPRLVKAINRAIKESQKKAAKKLTQMSGGLSGLASKMMS